jgi:murein DD-endopeptidase MepM/ murein hydrolase activator NlpD
MNNKLCSPVTIVLLSVLAFTAVLILPYPMLFAAEPDTISAPAGITVSLTPKRVQQGSVAKITLQCPPAFTPTSCTWQNIDSRLYEDREGVYACLIPISAQQKPGPMLLTVTLEDAQGTTFTRQALLDIIPKDFAIQHLTIEKSKATLSPEDLKRHTREREQILNMFKQSLQERQWSNAFSAPIQGRISTPFGVKRFINKEPRNPHSGVDIAAPKGTPIQATAAGRVTLTGEHFFAGKSVYLDHGNEIFSMYFHMDAISVREGQRVAAGDIIGNVGSTGRATGPHLHWGMRMHGIPVDPFSLLALFEN